MRCEIEPFAGVGELTFGMKRDEINNTLLKGIAYDPVENTNVKTGVKSTNDYFGNGLVLGYLNSSFLLRYVVMTYPCEAIFEGRDLLAMNYAECLKFLRTFDEGIEEERYIGFTSYKFGISIYAENATEDPKCDIEAVTVGERGYFEN